MQVILDIPEQYFLERSPAEMGRRIKLYAALLMFQSGELSAGAAAELAEVDRFTFAVECQRHGIPLIDYPVADLQVEMELIAHHRRLDVRDLRGSGGIRPDYDHKRLRR